MRIFRATSYAILLLSLCEDALCTTGEACVPKADQGTPTTTPMPAPTMPAERQVSGPTTTSKPAPPPMMTPPVGMPPDNKAPSCTTPSKDMPPAGVAQMTPVGMPPRPMTPTSMKPPLGDIGYKTQPPMPNASGTPPSGCPPGDMGMMGASPGGYGGKGPGSPNCPAPNSAMRPSTTPPPAPPKMTPEPAACVAPTPMDSGMPPSRQTSTSKPNPAGAKETPWPKTAPPQNGVPPKETPTPTKPGGGTGSRPLPTPSRNSTQPPIPTVSRAAAARLGTPVVGMMFFKVFLW